jgi:hypothetical protein
VLFRSSCEQLRKAEAKDEVSGWCTTMALSSLISLKSLIFHSFWLYNIILQKNLYTILLTTSKIHLFIISQRVEIKILANTEGFRDLIPSRRKSMREIYGLATGTGKYTVALNILNSNSTLYLGHMFF